MSHLAAIDSINYVIDYSGAAAWNFNAAAYSCLGHPEITGNRIQRTGYVPALQCKKLTNFHADCMSCTIYLGFAITWQHEMLDLEVWILMCSWTTFRDWIYWINIYCGPIFSAATVTDLLLRECDVPLTWLLSMVWPPRLLEVCPACRWTPLVRTALHHQHSVHVEKAKTQFSLASAFSVRCWIQRLPAGAWKSDFKCH